MKSVKVFLAWVGARKSSYPFCAPPLGILALGAYIRQQFPEAEIRLFDQRSTNASNDALLNTIVEFAPDIVGFSAATSSAHMMEVLTRGVRQALPNSMVLMGGPHVSAFGRKSMEQIEAHAAVCGEGERALEMLIHAHFDGGLDQIPGLIWRDASGALIENPGQIPFIEDLDALPFAAYDLLDMKPYAQLPPMGHLPPRRYVGMFTSRGCPYQCIYCHNIFGRKFHAQSAERIVAELEHLTRAYQLNEIEFYDDTFNYDPARVIEFNAIRAKRGLNIRISFPNSLRTDILTEEVLDALVESGMYYSAFALESGSPRIQKLIRKNLNISKFVRNVEWATRRGVFATGFTMMGFPTETEEELKLTIDVACQSQLHTASFNRVVPFPHTEVYDLALRTNPERINAINYDDADCFSIPVNLAAVPDETLLAYQRLALRRFFLSPRRLFRIVRDYPKRSYIPYYIPVYLRRQVEGILNRGN